ncbi:MAG: secretin N-terminal domain-containing protein [Gallionella sp.]
MHSMRMKFKDNAALLLLLMLAGCAGDKLHKEGISLIQEGRVEEGLATLEQAAEAEPDDLSIRKDLIQNRGQFINRSLSMANSERAVGNLDAAEVLYRRVLKLAPDDLTARGGIELLVMDRRHNVLMDEASELVKKGELDAAKLLSRPVLLENPKNNRMLKLQRQIEELIAKEQSSVQTLQSKFKKQVTLQFRDADLKMVFEALSRASGINILLDKDIKAGVKASIFVKNVSVVDAIDLLLMQNQMVKKVISDDTLFIYPNSAAKLKDYQDLKIRSFHLVNAEPKQMMTLIKEMLKTKDIYINEKTNSLVMRDTPEAIRLAEKMIHDQDIAEPEVMLEVEVLEIGRSRLSQIGVKFPTQLSFTALGQAVAAGTPTLTELRTLNSNSIVTGPALSLAINAMLQDGDTNILASPRIRVRNRDKAKIMIGERVPMITNSLTPQNTGSAVVTGTVQYQDVGLKLEVEPDIHLDHEVSIKIGLEVSSLGTPVTNSAGSLVYRVGTRNTSTVLRLKDGETQILAGLINDNETNTLDKVPALGEMPLLGHLFSSKNGNKVKTEIILSITPHIVGNVRVPDAREEEYWTGTETTLRSEQLMLKSRPAATLPAAPRPAARPAPAVAQPAVGQPVAQVAQPVVFSWDGVSQAHVGDLISLSFNAQTPQPAGKFGLQMSFDPAVLKAMDVVEGGYMKPPATLVKHIEQQAGVITADLSGESGGGSDTLLTLMFEVIAEAPQTAVSVTRITANATGGAQMVPVAPAPHQIAVTK